MEYHLLLAINFYDGFHSIFFRKMIITSRKTVSQNPFRETKRGYAYIAFCIKGVANFMLQQRIFITTIAIPISAEDSFLTRIVLKEKSEILLYHF